MRIATWHFFMFWMIMLITLPAIAAPCEELIHQYCYNHTNISDICERGYNEIIKKKKDEPCSWCGAEALQRDSTLVKPEEVSIAYLKKMIEYHKRDTPPYNLCCPEMEPLYLCIMKAIARDKPKNACDDPPSFDVRTSVEGYGSAKYCVTSVKNNSAYPINCQVLGRTIAAVPNKDQSIHYPMPSDSDSCETGQVRCKQNEILSPEYCPPGEKTPNDGGEPQRDQGAKTFPEPNRQGASPSFDCGKASAPDEQAICADDGLAGLDLQTTNEWRRLRGTDKDSATRIARELLTARKTCGMNKGCIRKSQEQALANFRAAGVTASSSGRSTASPSFDCGKANAADELAICSDDVLSGLDRQTTAAWRRRRDTDKESATQIAREFLRVRQACGSDKTCIRKSQEQALAKFRMP